MLHLLNRWEYKVKKTHSVLASLLALSTGLSFAATSQPQASSTANQGPCQLDASQEEKKWPFEIEYQYKTPNWSANKTATELMTMQAQYFSGNSSPFQKNKIPPELAFYLPQVKFKIQTYVKYNQTIDGRTCAQVVGGKLIAIHEPEVLLARELAAKNCVSRAALSHQLKHDKAAIEELKTILADKAEIKKLIFPTYEKQGGAGKTTEDIARQLLVMEKAATHALYTRFEENLRLARRQNVETAANFNELYSMCQGEFAKASSLAQPDDSPHH
jgi:hypothetical protein